jgi:hypothetical protein
MKVEIYIQEKNGDRAIHIPIVPEEIKFNRGETTFVTSEIMGLGEVSVPSGTELTTYSWSSEFPGVMRKNDPMIRGLWCDPKIYHNTLEDWHKNGTELNLWVVGYPVNHDVYLAKYEASGVGAFGDISYEIGFIEARHITIKTTKVEQKQAAASTTETKRPTTKSTSYTIKSGDTLWGISVKHYKTGTKWKDIYNANKDIIEQTAKKYGRSSSNNGHWIYPGVTLTIPDAG